MMHLCISLRMSRHLMLKCKIHMKTIGRKHYQVLWCQYLIPRDCGGNFIHFLIFVVCYQEMFMLDNIILLFTENLLKYHHSSLSCF